MIVENAQDEIDSLWDLFVPSTHHDYVTGTSTDYVVYSEQMPAMKYEHKSEGCLCVCACVCVCVCMVT
jgi:hypothetical protein